MNNNDIYDLVVIGGGVSGLMVAGSVGGSGRVLLLEKMEKPARKLRITGKGRGNITNLVSVDEFLTKVKQGGEFVRPSLELFTPQKCYDFFEKIGIRLAVERGNRVFPTGGQRAWDIAEAMIDWVEGQGAEIQCQSEVLSTYKEQNGNFVTEIKNKGSVRSRMVVITTGGVSYPSTGSTGDGYSFAYDMGHEIVPVRPSLVPLDIKNVQRYKKVELRNVGVRLVVDNEVVEERFGDVDFTDRALGGATILQVSRVAVDAIIAKKRVVIELDMKPALSDEKLRRRIQREVESIPTANYRVLLQKLIPSPLFNDVSEQTHIKLSVPVRQLTEDQISVIAAVLKGLKIPIMDYRPFTEAIVTAGGVALHQINSVSMESMLVPGLFFAGEVLDIDADTGGFNIQLALSTAYAAAMTISTILSK